jgi:hypothetical protein
MPACLTPFLPVILHYCLPTCTFTCLSVRLSIVLEFREIQKVYFSKFCNHPTKKTFYDEKTVFQRKTQQNKINRQSGKKEREQIKFLFFAKKKKLPKTKLAPSRPKTKSSRNKTPTHSIQ